MSSEYDLERDVPLSSLEVAKVFYDAAAFLQNRPSLSPQEILRWVHKDIADLMAKRDRSDFAMRSGVFYQ